MCVFWLSLEQYCRNPAAKLDPEYSFILDPGLRQGCRNIDTQHNKYFFFVNFLITSKLSRIQKFHLAKIEVTHLRPPR